MFRNSSVLYIHYVYIDIYAYTDIYSTPPLYYVVLRLGCDAAADGSVLQPPLPLLLQPGSGVLKLSHATTERLPEALCLTACNAHTGQLAS